MVVDLSFHFPPDLMQLLIDTIPLLCRSKPDVLLFFKGAGVPQTLLSDLAQRVKIDRQNVNKYEIARTVLTRLNENDSPSHLRMRREVVRRIVNFEDFSTCWEKDQLKARGLVAQIQKVVDVHDSFARMRQEREAERRKTSDKIEVDQLQEKARKDELARIKADLFALFGESDVHKRGKVLEGVLNRLFRWSRISICEEFTLRMDNGKAIEQVDGVVEIDGMLYLVEMKWWKDAIGVPEISQHISRVIFRGGQVRGIYISYSPFTDSAIETCKQGYPAGAVITLCQLQELIELIEGQGDLKAMLKAKVNASLLYKKPLVAVAI